MKFLCADIGGTHANFCMAVCDQEIEIREIAHLSTQNAQSFPELVNRYLESIGEVLTSACFAVAGVVKDQRVKMTNAGLVIDAREVANKTALRNVRIINDFEAVGYATNVLAASDIKVVNEGEPVEEGLRCAIGAGTGLGKSILLYDKQKKAYLPVSSEGGHADFAVASKEEWMFVEDMEQASWEYLISGKGIERIYQALQKRSQPGTLMRLSAKEISMRRSEDPLCAEAFEWFVKFYARAARNFAIELLAKGGVFLAGGIGASNSDLFGEMFMREFARHHLPQYSDLLKSIPVKLITNYDISLKGVAFAQMVFAKRDYP